jgi:hypothetical protein
VLKLPFEALHKVHFIDFHKKVSGRRAVNSKFLLGVKQPRKVMQISRKADYQKDPFTLKKSKYRYNTKAF